MAAELMDILVVSPLWLEQCKEAGSRVPEEDFLVSAIENGSSNKLPTKTPVKVVEPKAHRPELMRDINDPFYSSSQREFPPDFEEKSNNRKKSKGDEKVARPAPASKVTITVDKKSLPKDAADMFPSPKTVPKSVSKVVVPKAIVAPVVSAGTIVAKVVTAAAPTKAVIVAASKVTKSVVVPKAVSTTTITSTGNKAAYLSDSKVQCISFFVSSQFTVLTIFR